MYRYRYFTTKTLADNFKKFVGIKYKSKLNKSLYCYELKFLYDKSTNIAFKGLKKDFVIHLNEQIKKENMYYLEGEEPTKKR